MQRKNIFINILSARGGGGTTYVRNIVPELAWQDRSFHFTILASSKYQIDLIKELLELNIEIYNVKIPASPIIRFFWEQGILPFLLKKIKPDIYYQVTESCPLFTPCPVIINCRNSILFLPWREIKNSTNFLNKLVNLPIALLSFIKADKIICVSKSIENNVTTKYKITQNKVCLVHHGVNAEFRPLREKSKAKLSSYILSVSDLMPHKNYEALIKAFHLFLKKNPGSPIKLIIAGRQNGVYFTYIKNLVTIYRLEQSIRFTGSVPYEELPLLYSHARIFIFPSKVESFGIPLIEAMASGLPVIASDIPTFKEICGDAAIYFNPDYPEDLAEKIFLVLNNKKISKEKIKRSLKRSKDFSWKKTAAKLLTIFNEVN